MGSSATAHLIYGIDLGGDEPGWQFEWSTAGEDDGIWRPGWATNIEVLDDGSSDWTDPVEDIKHQLAVRLGNYPGNGLMLNETLVLLGLDVLATGDNRGPYERYWVTGFHAQAGYDGHAFAFVSNQVPIGTHLLMEKVAEVLGLGQQFQFIGWHLIADFA